MPEGVPSLPGLRCSALDEFARERAAAPEGTSNNHGRRTSPIRIKAEHLKSRKARADAQPSPTSKRRGTQAKAEPSPVRKAGSSIYYGVRFRPDLSKWVAEIRVAEWKAVDKKVWLGTFDTEEGAARGVDLARKLLRCQKKHTYNLPCAQLDAYSGHIPPHVVLTDVTATTMFKDATLFIKRECQAYAASFLEHAPATVPVSQTTESMDSEIVNENSDSDSCMMADLYDIGDSISIDDYLIDQSPSSCTSTTSCMTDQWDQTGSGLVGDALCVVATPVVPGGVPGAVQGWAADQCTWPGPVSASSSSALAPLPGSYYEMAPSMFHMDGATMDCDDSMSFHNFHYPFQHGFNQWC